MARGVSRHSIFSQRLDRAVFGAYFLGGILPLGALVAVVHQWVLPVYADEPTRWGWIVGLAFVSLLSLSLYFALRHITTSAIARMDADNHRLRALLTTSSELAEENHLEAILGSTAAQSRALTGANQLAILYAARADKELEIHSATDDAGRQWATSAGRAIATLTDEAFETGAPTNDGAGTVAVPFSRATGMRGAVVWSAASETPADAVDAVSTIAGMAGTAIERGDLADSQRNFFAHVTDLIVTALDAHVVGRKDHAMQTARLCNRLAHEVGLEPEQTERLHWGALLHDIGMLKTEPGRHTDRKAVRTHSSVGARMLGRIRLWEPVAPIVLHHHEWWDGSGYPEGISGADIPLEARIIGLADAVDAMHRSEKGSSGMSLPEVLEEVVLGSGTQFDPELVEAFRGLVERGEVEL
jgi:putative nucleotidyltransferase with HDIG domain